MAEQNPSKTRRKQEMLELQELGVELVGLDERALDALELPDALREAVVQARSVTSFEARRRQLQYIGKLMRRVDPGPIRAVLDERRAGARAEAAVFRRVESWRERLLNDPDSLAHLLAEHPSADPSRLRALVESARRERVEAGAPHSYKELFRALRELLGRYTPGP
jgi:ribosome-associated protein